MLSSICRHSCRRGLLRAQALSSTSAVMTLRAAPKPRVSELASHLSRRASTIGKKAYKPKGPPPLLSKMIIYHIGQARIYMLGALKVSVILIFGFVVANTVPTYLESDAPVWQAPLVIMGATIPVVAIWYLTYPMVVWMHISVPKEIQRSQVLLTKFLKNPAADMGVYITTMGPLCKPRVTYVKLADLKPVKQRFGLVNYIRDVTKENRERKWYQYRAIGKFMVENEPSPDMQKQRKRTPWVWYILVGAFRKRHGIPR